MRRAWAERGLRHRWALLTAWLAPWVWAGQRHPVRGDWGWLEMGSRILLHHHAPIGSGPGLAVYQNNSVIQMGPPALVVGGPFQWLPPHVSLHLAAATLAVCILPLLWCLEAAVVNLRGRCEPGRVLLAGLVAVPFWTLDAQAWLHLDDVIALLCLAVAAVLVSGGRHELAAGLVLGTGAAAKPWAVVLMPMLLAYARPRRPRAVLGFVAAALAWWLPFVLAAPGTVHALGSLELDMLNHPTWHLVGLTGRAPGWIRPLQLLGGTALSAVAVRKAGWAAVPLVALAWRVTSDPYDWPYYLMGPLVGALLWDLARPVSRRLAAPPWFTLSVVLVAYAAPRWMPGVTPGLRLVWFLGLTTLVLRARRGEVGVGRRSVPERALALPDPAFA